MRASGTRRTGRSRLPVSAPSNQPAGPRAGHRSPGSLARGARRAGRQRQVDVRGAPFRPGRGAFLRRVPRASQRGRGRSADDPNRVLDPSSRGRPTSRRPAGLSSSTPRTSSAHARRALVERARAARVPAIAIVLALPADVVHARNAARKGAGRRPVGRRSTPRPARPPLGDGGIAGATSSGISGEGFAAVHVLRSAAEVDEVVMERRPLDGTSA